MKKSVYCLLLMGLIISCEKSEDIGTKPTACFTYSSNIILSSAPIPIKDSVIFENCSTNATSYLWDFGDGTSSTEKNPTHIYNQDLPAIVSLTANNGSNSDVLIDTIWDWAIVYKPNIYIYPEETIDLCLSLNFPKGGEVVTSIPEYENEWCVNVEPSGLINGQYEFLFYESMQPNIWQKENGWVISKENLEDFFTKNMQLYGFNAHEINDFVEYWIPRLNKTDLYAVYPQTKNTIERVIELNFSVTPSYQNRLFYVIEEINEKLVLQEPTIKPFEKEGFYMNEWGVIIN